MLVKAATWLGIVVLSLIALKIVAGICLLAWWVKNENFSKFADRMHRQTEMKFNEKTNQFEAEFSR
jgi:hypothetical protein